MKQMQRQEKQIKKKSKNNNKKEKSKNYLCTATHEERPRGGEAGWICKLSWGGRLIIIIYGPRAEGTIRGLLDEG